MLVVVLVVGSGGGGGGGPIILYATVVAEVSKLGFLVSLFLGELIIIISLIGFFLGYFFQE